jgi:hypothetical protein
MSKEIQIETNTKSDRRIVKLVLGILFDAIGMLSYAIPGAAEFIDIVWAPIGAILLAKMYKGTVGQIGGVIEFLEEIIPGTDLIPTFTLTWIYEYYISGKHKK